CLYRNEVPVLVVVAFEGFYSVLCAVDRYIGNLPHQLRERAAVVDLAVLNDYVVYLFKIDLRLEVLNKLFVKRNPDRIDQGHFFVAYQIRVVRRPSMCRQLFTMERAQFPVYFTNPSNFFSKLFT